MTAGNDTPRSRRFRAFVTSGIAPDLLRGAANRLSLAGLLLATGCTIQLALSQYFMSRGWSHGSTFELRNTLSATSAALGAAVFLLARRMVSRPAGVVTLALFFEIVGGFLLVFPENVRLGFSRADGVTGISWLAVWLTAFPMIVPAQPWLLALAGLATASMSPLATAVAAALGFPTPAESTMNYAYIPNYIAAGFGTMAAMVMYRMRRQIEAARDVGSYRLVERLGAGGMGEVWRATHRMLARPAAIKLIGRDTLARATGAEADELTQRFEREAQATASLSSPHTVALYDFGMGEDGTFYYVMELLNGMDLQQLVERHGPLPVERVVALLTQACESLAEAHAHGLVHRDIKPANLYACVLGGRHDFIKVLDFGLVGRDFTHRDDVKLTAADTARGTPAFMPPEMANGQPVDGRTDLYSLGCVAYWLLTGRMVFEGDSALGTISQHMFNEPEPPSRRAQQPVPPELDAIVLRCLAKQPGERFADAGALAVALRAMAVAERWTEDRAAEWWRTHAPAAASASPKTPVGGAVI